jgi:hypothetical protein
MAGTNRFDVNTGLLATGLTLIGVAGLATAAGIAVTMTAILTASRRWVRQLDTPPRELARKNWTRAKSATGAGVSAWRGSDGGSQSVLTP